MCIGFFLLGLHFPTYFQTDVSRFCKESWSRWKFLHIVILSFPLKTFGPSRTAISPSHTVIKKWCWKWFSEIACWFSLSQKCCLRKLMGFFCFKTRWREMQLGLVLHFLKLKYKRLIRGHNHRSGWRWNKYKPFLCNVLCWWLLTYYWLFVDSVLLLVRVLLRILARYPRSLRVIVRPLFGLMNDPLSLRELKESWIFYYKML